MADKRVQYTLGFTADTAKAKAQLRDLQNQLDHLTSASGNIKNLPITEEVFKATAAAKELQASLQKAINVNTGKLDLSILSDEFAKSGKSINDYAQEFYKLGPAGEAAFAKIGNAIVQSEAPLKRTNKLIQELQISLANTIKWQLSSSAIHAFMGAVQGAYGYAQDLNESLNNIRIVTGKSTEEMAKFAKQANTAAKALSTRTTDYTDAALIYYQQGLPEEEIQERAEVTVKMANVSRESAQIVSDQMTAVWNNFYNGSKSLEYYADVMTALGAATASSTDEIATGLEKFAAISNTVGLSYEYATSALATVTATTRQSADVVGTAFRTMFTRIQGLQQGETADDGVDLNKYSQALDNVGIQILDTNGQIKEMDTILSELGERWKTLGKEQQIALAQTVGGARQYTTLVALMDNWTFFQENLQTSYGAAGELNKQQEIYAESWEAARDRVTAALEKIYKSILNDEFFIDLNNFLADSIELFDKLIDTVGGLPGVIGILGLSLSKLYNDKLPKFFNGIRENLQYTTGVRQGNAESFRNSFLSTLSDEALYNDSQKQLIESDVNSIYKERLSFLEKSNDLTGAQIIKYRQLIELEKEFGLKAIQVGAEEDKIKLNLDNYKKDLKNNVINRSVLNPDYTMSKTDAESQFELYQYNLSENIKKIKIAPEEITEDFINDVKEVLAKEEGIGEYLSDALFRDMSFEEDFDTAAIIFKDRYNKMRLEIIKSLSNVSSDGKTPFDIVSAGNITDEEINEYIQGMDKYNESQEKSMEVGEQFSKINEKIKDTIRGKTDAQKEDSDFLNENTTILKIFQEDLKRIDQGLVEAANGLGAFSIGWSSLSAAMSTLNNDSLSFFDKLPTLLSSGITGFISLGSAAKSFQTVNNLLLKDEGRGLAIQIASIFLKNEEIEALKNEITLKTVLSILQEKLNLQQIKSNLLSAQNLKNILNLAAGAGKLLLIIGALAVAWKGLTWLFNKWKESTPEGRLEKLTNETESARTAAQDAATAYNDLKTAIQDLESAENSIAKMTKGTLEWQYAIEEANAKALELINTYGLIQGKDWDFDKNGMIEIFKFGQEKMFEQQLEAKRNADALVDVSDKATREQEISNKIKIIENKLGANLSEDYLLDLYAKRNEIDTSVYGDSWSDIESLAKQIQQNNLLNVATVESRVRTSEELTDLLEPANLKTEEINAIYKWLAEDIANKDFSEEVKNVSQEQLESWAKTQGYEYKNNKFYEEDEDGKEVEVENLDLDKVRESIAYQDYLEDILGDQDEIGKYVSKALQIDFTELDIRRQDYNLDEINRLSDIKSEFKEEDLEILEDYKQHIADVNENLETTDKMTERIAVANMAYNDGLEDLIENFENYQKMLSNGKGTEDYSKALKALQQDMSKILDIDIDELSEEWITNTNNLELMRQAANGSLEAITSLRESAALDVALNLDIDKTNNELLNAWNVVKSTIENSEQFEDLEVGMELSDGPFVDALNQLMWDSAATVDDIQAMLNSIGFEPVIDYIPIPADQYTSYSGEVFLPDGKGGYEKTTQKLDANSKQTFYMPQIRTKDSKASTGNGSGTSYRGAPKLTASKKSSGGGSKKDKKSSSKEIERYHVISNEMEEIQNELDKISTATERAFGADKLALIDDEIQKMKELKDAQDEYVRQIEENFEKDKQAIAAYGAVFNKNGTILNYEEIMQRQIDKFNASRTDAAEEEYQKFLDLLKQYEETNDLLDKERNESIKQAGELLDKELEDIEHRVNLQVEFNDDTIEYLEFLLEQLEDQAFSAAQSIDLLGRQVQENFDNIKSNSSGLAETLALAGFDSETIDGVLTGDQAAINKMMSQKGIDNNIIESVKEYRDALMGSMSNVRDLQKAIDEELINSLDEASEKFGELHDELNHNADILSSLQNIMDLTGESILGFTDDAKKALEDAQLDTAVSQVATSYDELTAAQEEYKKAVESDQSEEVIKAAAEKVREAEEQLLSDWEAALEQATTNFEASIERSVAAFSNAVAGAYGGLDELQDAFDKQEELDDIYIEDYKKIYELTKLSRDISRSIDDSDNIKAKQALRDLQGEINELQKEGVELSEYDIEYLQKKYELRLAEIALEEAQNAKSTVRMTRDSEGNWSYTYTADQDDINEAQQNYEDKLYAIQELSDNYIKDMQSQVLDLLSAYEDEMAKINFSEEGWEQKAKEIEAFYQAKFNLLAQQFEGALGNQSDIYGEWENYSALTGYGISANQDFIDSFDETTLSQLTGFQTMGEYQQVFTTNSQKLLTDLSGSFMDWRDHVQRIYEQAGKSTEDFAEKVGDMAEGVKEDNQSVVDSSESLKNEVIDNFEKAANGASAFADTWNEKIKTMTDSNNDLVESINDIIEAWARLNNAEEEKNNKQEQNEQEEKNDSSISNNNNNNKTLSENDSVSVKTSATHFATGQQMAGFVPGGSYSVMQVSGDRVLIGRNGVATGWVKKTDLVGFHSGGYTGEWGSSGKLAMLHEKELVLNANDTKNILTSVELMREISQAIDLNASMSAYSNAISAAMPNTGVITNQNIVINAEFPDATDRLEIQAAFDNLLNRASQYANRK